MHSYLKSIGFSEIDTKDKEERLLNNVIRYANTTSMICVDKHSDEQYVEYCSDVGPGFGITVRGRMDEDDHFHVDHYFPYYRSNIVTSEEESFISKKSENDSYGVICEDYRVGVSLIFNLQNAVDYLRVSSRGEDVFIHPVKLSALALEGTILFPTLKTEEEVRSAGEEILQYAKMMADAKKGDLDAIDSLTHKEIDAFSMVNERLKEEDIFSIVDTSFAPYGLESEVYRILGNIIRVRECTNVFTRERVYQMDISCNHIMFGLCVNAANVVGVPEAGRRFRGIVWLQGRIEFDKEPARTGFSD